MNIYTKKGRKTFTLIIVVLLVLAMVVTMVAAYV